ncbi:MAG: S-layer homology domain-containing protein [Oscillospiraceae bacterium]|nr:S-layer homology domain-containing protein [Oscillospiraceae bacterium]
MKKTIVSVIAATAALCITAPAFAASSFSDISGSSYSWCAPQIRAMADAGYVHGYDDGTFKPDNQVTKLEGIALFARAMGSDTEITPENTEVLELAHSQYDSALKSYSLSWGDDEATYLLYKNALSISDLDTYLKGDLKNQPLTRGEAAVIITKAMGGGQSLKQVSSITVDYADKSSIPSNVLPYVDYVTEQGIMNGIDDEFQPGGTVTRAQIAVMLYRVANHCDYSFIRGKLKNVDEDESTFTISVHGEETTYSYDENTQFTLKGEYELPEKLTIDAGVVIQLSGDKVVSIDGLSDQPEATITAIFSSYSTSNGITYIKVKESATSSTTKSYPCVDNVPVTYKGAPATVKNFSDGDSITIEIVDGKVLSIVGSEKTETITGATVDEIEVDGESVKMTISSANSAYNGKTYEVASDAVATKASKECDMSDIYVGDKVTLTLRYGKIIKAEATSTYGSVSGSIVEVKISNNPSITVRAEGKEKEYQIPVDCIIIVNQKEGSLYDFRVGDSVTLTTQSSAVTKIQVSTAIINDAGNGTGSVNGTVTAVNTAYGFISVLVEGYDIPVPVYKTSNQTTFITAAGKPIDFKSIKTGDKVECRGTTTNGAFVASLVIVTQAD